MQGKVVYTFSCTDRIQKLCDQWGLPTEVTKIGFKYIGEIMAREHVLVGGEESGGIAVTGHAPERDGIYVGLTVLELMAKTGKSLSELIRLVYDEVGPFAVHRNDLHLSEGQKIQILSRLKGNEYSSFGEYRIEKTESLDGFKFRLHTGDWVMVRPSGTEPVLRIYAEAGSTEEANRILKATVQTLV